MSVIRVKNLTKKFGNFVAVDHLAFTLGEGEILGLLGSNGAGKTTTLQMLLGVMTPTAGDISYFGKSFFRFRQTILDQVGFSSTYVSLPSVLTVEENLTCMSYLYTIPDRRRRLREIREIFHLGPLWSQKVGRLSAGQQTRVNLAKAFLNAPRVVLLDEPTAALDPEIADEMRTFLLRERRERGMAMIFTSHNMAEVEQICDRVLFLREGKIVGNDRPDALAQSIQISHVELRVGRDRAKLIAFCVARKIPHRVDGMNVIVDVAEREIAAFLQAIGSAGLTYQEISIAKPSLEDYFLEMAKSSTV